MTIYHRPRKSDPPMPLVLMRNVSGGTLLRGSPVVLATTSVDGVGVTIPSTQMFGLFKGILWGDSDNPGDLPDGAYGLFQIGGYCDYALVAAHSITPIAIGDQLSLVDQEFFLSLEGVPDGRPHFFHSLEAIPADIAGTVAARKVDLGHGC